MIGKRWVLLTLSLILISSAFAAPRSTPVDEQNLQAVAVTRHTNGMTMNLQLPQPVWGEIPAQDGDVMLAEVPGAGLYEVEGMPVVPVVSGLFRIPATGGVEVEVLNAEYETLTDVEYATINGYEDGEAIFGSLDATEDVWYPENIAEVAPPAIFRVFRVASLQTFPVQVNAFRREVRVYSDIDVDLVFTQGSGVNELAAEPTKLSETYLPFYRSLLDWDESELDEFELYRGTVQVVTRENSMQFIQEWIEWKKQKGYELEFITDGNVTWNSSGIKTALTDRWNGSDEKFDWVVLIGDNTGSYSTPVGSGYGDHYYAKLDGNDELPEVGVGRISAETPVQFGAYVQKVLGYEREPYMDNTDWYVRGLVTAASSNSGLSTVHLGRYARHAMFDIGYTEVDTAWYYTGGVDQATINSINQGVSCYSHRGYIGSGLDPSTINNLNNIDMNPMVLDITCATGNWTTGLGHNEAWMRAGTATEPTGGIGAISTATSSTDTRHNNALSGGALESMLVRRVPEMGGTVFNAKVNLYRAFHPQEAGDVHSFAEWGNMMGDPTVWLWTGIPQYLDITAPDNIELGTVGYEVTVEKDGAPVEGAWVTLYKSDDNEEVIARAVTGSSGIVTLSAPFEFEGEAILTVTGQNLHPYQQTIPVDESQRIGYVGINIVDDGSQGTSGDSDGIAEAGETVGLLFTLHNYGTASRPDVELTLSTDDIAVGSVSGTATFGAIGAGQDMQAQSVVLVELLPETQDDWIAHFEATISSGVISITDDVALTIGAPRISFSDYTLSTQLEPGTAGTVTFDLKNIGTDVADAGTARLISLDNYFNVNGDTAPVGEINVGATVTTGEFDVAAHPSGFSGYPAKAMIELTTNSGQIDTTYCTIILGVRTATDPVGPDNYGYIAFDDRDVDYDLAPDFDWVEISTDAPSPDYNGTEIQISDTGEDQEDATVVNTPFTIQYYGEEFDELTITTSGFVAMGNQADMPLARNWPIPSPLGANYMIAPYWDNLVTNSGSIWTYYDEPNHRFIIEFYNLGIYDATNQHNTFQIIFYDQAGEHQTISGDANIAFQYLEVNSAAGPYWDNDYFTTGIENGDQQDGLQIEYWNGNSTEVVDGRAILFTTQIELITGTIAGTVTYAIDDAPAEGMTVRTADGVFVTQTDANGDYVFDEIVIGTHDVVCEGQGINTVQVDSVQVMEGQITALDFSVTQPGFDLNVTEIQEQVEPESTIVVPMTLTNPGDGPLDFTINVDPTGPELDEDWELVESFEAQNDMRNRGLTFFERHIWVSGANMNQNPNKFHIYTPEGNYLTSFNQPHVDQSQAGLTMLTTDGDYLYGIDVNTFYKISFDTSSFELNVEDSFTTPSDYNRYLAYVPDQDIFLMGERYTPIYAVDRDGNTVFEVDHPEIEPKSIAWYPGDEDGKKLYIWTQETAYDPFVVVKMDPQNFLEVDTVAVLPAETYQIKDCQVTYLWNPAIWAMISLQDGGASVPDRVHVHEMALNTAWMNLSLSEGTLQPGETAQIDLTIQALDLPDGEYTSYLRFDHNSYDMQTYVPVTVEIGPIAWIAGDGRGVVPQDWKFEGVYPNPFNPTAAVRFTLKQATNVNVRLYNVLGQQVLEAMDQRMQPGRHEVILQANNLASGVYFLRLNAGPLQATRKVVLLR